MTIIKQKLGFKCKSVVLILNIKQFIVLTMRTYVPGVAQHVTSDVTRIQALKSNLPMSKIGTLFF